MRYRLAQEPDRLVWHEPIPFPGTMANDALPGWLNVTGLLWRPARNG
jgi:hypothetical protein